MEENGRSYINDQIANIGGLKKFLDFKDSLVPANLEDYAMLHGEGGRKHARVSTIKLAITDYSKGRGPGDGSSVYVQANVPPALMEILRSKCLENMGTNYVPVNSGLWSVIISAANAVKLLTGVMASIRTCLGTLFAGLRQAAVSFYQNGDTRTDVCMKVGDAFRKAYEALKAQPQAGEAGNANGNNQFGGDRKAASGLIPLPVVHDYSYSQVRVNMYERGRDNKVPVSQVNITRNGFRQDGSASRYPWTIQISQFRAKENVAANGTSSYDSKTISDKMEASIQVTDEDLFTATTRVCHYIEVWENAVCIPIVREGLNQREKARKNWAAQQQQQQPRQQPPYYQ